MEHKSKSFVIAITGVSGAGKTSLVKEVTALLDHAVAFYFDDYTSTHDSPEDLAEWIESGFDPGRWKNPRLLEDLRLLSYGTPVIPPDAKNEVKPAHFIVMEEPFGRTREGMAELVDFVACIDVPLDIPLARRIIRELDHVSEENTVEDYVEELRHHLDWYLNASGREAYELGNEKAMEQCELVLDGRKPVADLAQKIVLEVNRIIEI